ncbi:MAG: L-serine ammonia-lyase [Cellvibrionaceae bacterium]
MVVSVFDLFSVGIGPSSSHTVGPMRAANRFLAAFASLELSSQTLSLRVTLYGSLAATGDGHGTPQAVILGLLGHEPENINPDKVDHYLESVEKSGKIITQTGQEFHFDKTRISPELRVLPFHPNGMKIQALDQTGHEVLKKVYFSVGGGFVVETETESDMDVSVDKSAQSPDHKSHALDFGSGEDLLNLCRIQNISIAELMRRREQELYCAAEDPEQQIRQQLHNIWSVMQSCVERGLTQQGVLPGRLQVKRRAALLFSELNRKGKDHRSDPLHVMDWVNLYALAVSEENAAGGRVVTAPTNGAAGIIPAVLHYYRDFVDSYQPQGVEDFLLTAAAIGSLYKMNASISGAEVGCQGEVGSACSMAAAGLTAVLGGTPEQIEYAAEIAMEHNLGLTCDPIEGLVQVPCIERNAIASVKAINASRMALQSNGEHCVSLDEVIKTMRETGRDMSQKYKETATGGLAVEVPVRIIEC